MADQSSILAIVILAVGVTVHFSLHKVEEGHVGVYYRVCCSWLWYILLVQGFTCLKGGIVGI